VRFGDRELIGSGGIKSGSFFSLRREVVGYDIFFGFFLIAKKASVLDECRGPPYRRWLREFSS